jgi:hypothetical protein
MVAAMDNARRSQYAVTQYREANCAEAKSALEQCAGYLESQNLLPENGSRWRHR